MDKMGKKSNTISYRNDPQDSLLKYRTRPNADIFERFLEFCLIFLVEYRIVRNSVRFQFGFHSAHYRFRTVNSQYLGISHQNL